MFTEFQRCSSFVSDSRWPYCVRSWLEIDSPTNWNTAKNVKELLFDYIELRKQLHVFFMHSILLKIAAAAAAASGTVLKSAEGHNVTDLDFTDDIVLIVEQAKSYKSLVYKFGNQRGKWIGFDKNAKSKCMKIASYVAIEGQRTAGWQWRWILLSWKHNNPHLHRWQGSQNTYGKATSVFKRVNGIWRQKNINSALWVADVVYIAALCRNMANRRKKTRN